jgi:hypothetical protein
MKIINSIACLFGIVCLAGEFLCGGASAQGTNQTMQQSNGLQDAKIVTDAMARIRKHEFQNAKELLQPGAEKGYPESQALLGQMCHAGWGMAPDYKEAFKWWSRAAEAGSADGQWGLGMLYDEGKGVQQDSKKATEWWEKSFQQGNVKATVSLAYLYDEGRGVELDLKKSAMLFKRAAEKGDPFAQVNYGLKLVNGEGVEKDATLGCAWICVAADTPSVKGSKLESKVLRFRINALAGLTSEERNRVEVLKKQIQSKNKLD